MIRTRHIFSAALLLLLTAGSYAQDEQHTTDVTTLNFFSPGIGYEKSISKNATLFGSFFLAPSFYYSSGFGGEEIDFHMDPGFTFQYRYYYNFYARSEKGKRTDMNSANYIAPTIFTVFSKERLSNSDIKETDRRAVTSIGAVWGMQRNYRKRFSLDLNLGVGYYFAKGTTVDGSGNRIKVNHEDWSGLGNLTLGFWINKRK